MDKLFENLIKINEEIINDKANDYYHEQGWLPLYKVSPKSKIVIIGQAPGIKAQSLNETWMDKSGDKLREWLGVTREEFYNTDLFAQIPMDFYYPGKAKTGDLPPRADFAPKWHHKLLSNMPDVELIILIGNYSQKFYLKDKCEETLTKTVKNYNNYLPKYIPLPHPSPLNFRWFNNNPWFELEVLPILKVKVNNILKK